jgi:GNAT superfamily N-acetyltransferase
VHDPDSDYPAAWFYPLLPTRHNQGVNGRDTEPAPAAPTSQAAGARGNDTALAVASAPIADPVCQDLLRRYIGELEARLGREFDASRASPPGRHDFDPPAGVFVVARLSGRPVGCGGVRTLEPGVAEIRRMYVDPSARGHGVGSAVLAALEHAAREMGHQLMRLDTAAELHEAHRLYEGAGYVAVPAYNDNEFAARWYEKRLA